MSIQAMSWVIDNSPSDLRAGEYLVMLMIANHLGKTGEAAFPTIHTLAEEARLSKQQTVICLKKLEGKELLIIDRGGGRGHISRYRLPGYEGWLKRVKKLDSLPAAETVKPPDPLESGETVKQVDPLPEINSQIQGVERVKSLNVKGQVSPTPPTPPYKVEPSLTVKEPSAHACLLDYHAKRIGPIPNGAAEGAAVKWILEKGFSVEQAIGCYEFQLTEEWRHGMVSWLTVKGKVGAWVASQPKPISMIDRAAKEAELRKRMGWDKLEQRAS